MRQNRCSSTATQGLIDRGYYGGSDSFNLRFVHETLLKALAQRSDLVFLFMNVHPFAQHERRSDVFGNGRHHRGLRESERREGMTRKQKCVAAAFGSITMAIPVMVFGFVLFAAGVTDPVAYYLVGVGAAYLGTVAAFMAVGGEQ